MAVGGSTCGVKGGYSNEEGPKSLGGAKKVAKKVVKKRVSSPYNKFVKAQFPVMKAKYPKESAPQIMKRIAQEWQKQKK